MKGRLTVLGAAGVGLLAAGLAAAAPGQAVTPPIPASSAEDARRSVQMLADFYRTSLLETHVTYVKDGKPPAATVFRQVFAALADKGWPRARWLSVNGRPMNPDNVPKDAFEVEAARAIRRGEPLVEQVGNGRYRAVAALPFTGPCLKCHWGDKESDYVGAISFTVPLAAPKSAPSRKLSQKR
jgi:hypothetical protein